MRLREMKKSLESNIENLNIVVETANLSSGTVYHIKNCFNIIDTLFELEQFDFLRPYIQNIKSNTAIYNSRLSITTVDNSKYTEFVNQINLIKSASSAVINAINQVIPEQNELSISVKLPEINNLNELISFTEELNICLSQVILNPIINGSIRFQNFESGSNWFEIILGSLAAVKAIKEIVISAIDIKMRIMEIEKSKQNIRAISASTDIIETVCKELDKQVKELSNKKAESFIESNAKDNKDKEYFERVSNSIKIMGELMVKGTEVHLALNAPKELKDSNLDFKTMLSDVKELKQITDGKSED